LFHKNATLGFVFAIYINPLKREFILVNELPKILMH